MQQTINTWIYLVCILLLASCTTRKEIVDSNEEPEPALFVENETDSDPKAPKNSTEAKPTDKGVKHLTSPASDESIRYSETYEEEIRKIFKLAKENKWEDAHALAQEVYQKDPDDPALERLQSWVAKQKIEQRSKALEDKIREIDADNSIFNPGLVDLFTEHKDRGLPPRKDLRDAVQKIDSSTYVPENFGKTITRSGRLHDPHSEKGRMSTVLDQKITVHLDDVSLADIIFNIGSAEGINFVADKTLPAFAQKLSIHMDNVALTEFLDYVSRNLAVHFQVGEDLIWVIDAAKESNKALMEETRFFRLSKGFVIPAQYGVSEVDRTTVTAKGVTTVTEKQKIEKFVQDGAPENPYIEEAIKEFFEGSKYLIDYERNLIVARGTPAQLKVIENIVSEFDKPIQQVFIEARFVTVTEAVFQQLGASWETGRGPGRSQVADFTDLLDPDIAVGLGLEETFAGILNRENLSVTLTALEQSGESQTLSAPRLTLINNRPAKISDGRVQYYYEEYSVSQQITDRATASQLIPKGKPVSVTAGVSLEVLASIGADGKNILLALHPEVNQDVKLVTFATVTDRNAQGDVISTFDIRLPESRTQELATRVIVESGQTVVMGGVLEREQLTYVESVPILGRIPLLGAAFRKRTQKDSPRYLLIFVTATLLSESGEFIIFEDAVTEE